MSEKPQGEGWLHRIDAIPKPGRTIEFRSINNGEIRSAKVKSSAHNDFFYKGCGDDMRLDMGTHLLIPSMTYDYWRYSK